MTPLLAIDRSSYHEALVRGLEEGARSALLAAGVPEEKILTVVVPGAFEIPLACQRVIEERHAAGVVALGIILQGETHHAEEIARACTDGIMAVQLRARAPVAHGIVFADDLAVAEARCGGTRNRGREAAEALLRSLPRLP